MIGGVVAMRGGSSSGTAPADAAVAQAVVVDAAVVEDEGAADARMRIIIGEFGGDGMTDGIRATARPALATMLAKLAPDIRATLSARPSDERAGRDGRAFLIDLQLGQLDVGDGNIVQCKVSASITSFPERAIIARAQGGAKVSLQSRTLKELDLAGTDCVDAVTESLLTRSILPALRGRLGGAAGSAAGSAAD